MSMLPEQLDLEARADINRFFNAVFGWSENSYLSAPGSALVLGWDEAEPLVFLLEHEEAMLSPGHDHFALGVDGVDELERVEARALAFAATDDRTTVLTHNIDDYGVAKLHNIFIRFLIPLLIEVQYLEIVES
ncbi:MAG: hypothetical protein GXP35_18425 [Actinobacteria bacterium]|nr:hypothetical protein [Actinomycetota bacterium]